MGFKDQYLSTKEAAELLGYSTNHIRLLAEKGEIAAVKRGHAWFFTKEDVEAMIVPNDAKPEDEGDEINIG